MKKQSTKKLKKQEKDFCQLRSPEDLARLLKTDLHQLELMAGAPIYYTFSVPKKDGSKRWVENPQKPLKKIQRKINVFLQAVVYGTRTEAAYGFMTVAKNDPDSRHILSNAQKHLGCQFLYNADIEDFFHQVKFENVYQLFSNPPFHCTETLAILLTKLCTHKERLPMGAPTSPAISNLVCIPLDKELLKLAQQNKWTYTRYADDLSFSAATEIKIEGIGPIVAIVEAYGYKFNPEKIKYFGPEDEKKITGLIVGDEVSVPDDFMEALYREIQKLANVIEVQQKTGGHATWVQTYRHYVHSKINFVEQIMGDDDVVTTKLQERYEEAIDPPDLFESVRWLDFPYT